MARSYYKDGMPLAVKDRKEKFARYNIDRDLNHIFYSYQLKGGSTFSAGEDENLGSTLSEFINRIRLNGDTEIVLNLTKDRNLFPAGRLRGVRAQTNQAPVYATDGETAIFSNSENLSFIAKQDIINLGGKDQFRVISEDELTTKDPITGDKRNVGLEVGGASNEFDTFAVDLPSGDILVWETTHKRFFIVEDLSNELAPGEFLRTDVSSDMPIASNQELHDIRKFYNDGEKSYYALLVSTINPGFNQNIIKFFSIDVNNVIEKANISSQQSTLDTLEKRGQISVTSNDNKTFYVKSDNEIISFNFDFVDGEFIFDDLGRRTIVVDSQTIGATDNYVYAFTRELDKRKDLPLNTSYNSGASIYEKDLFQDREVVSKVITQEHDGVVSPSTFVMVSTQVGATKDTWLVEVDPDTLEVVKDVKLTEPTSGSLTDIYLEYNSNTNTYALTRYSGDISNPNTNWTLEVFDENFNLIKSNDIVSYPSWNDVYGIGLNREENLFIVGSSPINLEAYDCSTGDFVSYITFYGESEIENSGYVTLIGNWLFYNKSDNDNGIRNWYFEPATMKFIEHSQTTDGKIFAYTKGQQLYKYNSEVFYEGKTTASSTGFSGSNAFKFTPEERLLTINYDRTKKRLGYYTDYENYQGIELWNYKKEFLSVPVIFNSGSDVKIKFIYYFDNNSQYFKKYDSDLNFVENVIVKDATYELFPNFSKKLTNNRVMFGFAGSAFAIDESNNQYYNELIAKDGKDTELINITDLEEEPETGYIVGNGMPWSKLYLRELSETDTTEVKLWNNLFGLTKSLQYAIPPKIEQLSIDGIDYNFRTTNDWNDEAFRQDGLKLGGRWTRISRFGNEQIYVQGYGQFPGEEDRGGIWYNKWSTPNPNDFNISALGDEDRSQDILGGNDIFGQQIFLTRNIRMTPTGDGSANHYSYDASRIDIPKFQNKNNEYIKFSFLLDAAIKGVNVKYLDIDFKSSVQFNQIQFINDNDDLIPFEIADTNWDTGEHLQDSEILNPDLFNDGNGNQAWNILKAYPIVNGSEIKWEFWDVTTLRYYEALFESVYNSDGDFINYIANTLEFLPLIGLDQRIINTMIQDTQYMQLNSIVPFRKFSGELLQAMYAGTVGAQPNGADGSDFATADGNFGLDVADNRFFQFNETTTEIPKRRWETSNALMIQDSFMINGILGLLPDYFFISKPILNPKLFNTDGSHTETYKQFKNDLVSGTLIWNGTTYSQKFSEENSGELSTIVKDNIVTNWSTNSLEDPKFAVLMPNTVDEVRNAIKASGEGENPQSFKSVKVNKGILSDVLTQRVNVPVAEGMYSRLDQRPFTSESYASDIGLRTNSKIRFVFPTGVSPKRFRISAFGGEIWTFTEYDANFNLAVDSEGDEVIPRGVQSPNVSLRPNSAFKDIILGL